MRSKSKQIIEDLFWDLTFSSLTKYLNEKPPKTLGLDKNSSFNKIEEEQNLSWFQSIEDSLKIDNRAIMYNIHNLECILADPPFNVV